MKKVQRYTYKKKQRTDYLSIHLPSKVLKLKQRATIVKNTAAVVTTNTCTFSITVCKVHGRSDIRNVSAFVCFASETTKDIRRNTVLKFHTESKAALCKL